MDLEQILSRLAVALGIGLLIGLVIAAALEHGRFAAQTAILTVGCSLAGLAALWATLALGAG